MGEKNSFSLSKVQVPLPHFIGSNLWLLKPSFLNRGRGIYVVNSLEDMRVRILESISQSYPGPRPNLPSSSMAHFSTGLSASPLRLRPRDLKPKRKKLAITTTHQHIGEAEEASDEEERRYPARRSISDYPI